MKITMLAVLSLVPVALAGPLQISFTNPSPTALAGAGVDFYGVITNLGPDTVYLNSNSFTLGLDAGNYTLTDYFFNTPLSLDSGMDSGEILLFRIDVSSPFSQFYGMAWPGIYGLLGGIDGSSADNLGQQSFNLTVLDPDASAVPEPSALALSGSALCLLIWARKRPRSTTKPVRYTGACRHGIDGHGSATDGRFNAPIPQRRLPGRRRSGRAVLSATPQIGLVPDAPRSTGPHVANHCAH